MNIQNGDTYYNMKIFCSEETVSNLEILSKDFQILRPMMTKFIISTAESLPKISTKNCKSIKKRYS